MYICLTFTLIKELCHSARHQWQYLSKIQEVRTIKPKSHKSGGRDKRSYCTQMSDSVNMNTEC